MIERFDIRAWLEDRGVRYSREGKNVSSGWIGVKCPWCGDPSNHLGVNLRGKFINCWRCGKKGDIITLIRELEQCSFSKAKSIIEEFQDRTFEVLRQDIQKRHSIGEILPKEAIKKFPDLHLNYLKKRNFDPDIIIPKYGLLACGNIGNWKFRIIAPVFQDGRVVNFTARDVTGESRSKYRHCPNDRAIVPMKECLYNIDTVRGSVLVVEGPADVWRMGDGCVSTMGIEWTQSQVWLLANRDVKRAFVLFDAEDQAQKQAEKLAVSLSIFIPEVNVLGIPKGDPGDLDEQSIQEIRRRVFG
jgi:DNA primase